MGIIAGGQVCGTQVEGEAYDGLQNLAFDRQQMDLYVVLIAHSEGTFLVERQSFGVGGSLRDGHVSPVYCLDRQGAEAGGGKTIPYVEQV